MSARYRGLDPVTDEKEVEENVQLIRRQFGSQWSICRDGVICSCFDDRKTTRAALFWIFLIFLSRYLGEKTVALNKPLQNKRTHNRFCRNNRKIVAD